ncbi:MAG: DUF1887 family protein [Leptospiraceae bacterium]|nr:DUF1887 family protein [Leptospiraceae bacterium]
MDHKITDLVISIGTNPLPAYITGKYFKDQSPMLKRIWFVYTEQTKKYANNLKSQFIEDGIEVNQAQLTNESSSVTIKREFQKQVIEKLPKDSEVHFNYTGGTKTMSVQMVQSLKEFRKDQPETLTFSYLNARDFKIYIDGEEKPISGDLRKKIKPTIDEILKLHGYTNVAEKDEYKNSFRDLILKIEESLQERLNFLDGFYGLLDCLKRNSHYKSEFIKEGGELRKCNLGEKEINVLNLLPSDFQPFQKNGEPNQNIDNKKLIYTIEFLKGKWLELYVEHIILKYLTLKKDFVSVNYEIRDPEWSKSKNDQGKFKLQFELDVIVLIGYQIYAISCTTSHERPICKSKGFEILKRSKQIGGEEARSILITGISDHKDLSSRDLQDELENDSGNKGDILVLGKSDWNQENLKKKLKEYIGREFFQ